MPFDGIGHRGLLPCNVYFSRKDLLQDQFRRGWNIKAELVHQDVIWSGDHVPEAPCEPDGNCKHISGTVPENCRQFLPSYSPEDGQEKNHSHPSFDTDLGSSLLVDVGNPFKRLMMPLD